MVEPDIRPRRRLARASLRGGFTLIEVTVTVLIMTMLLVSITQILTAARTSRDTIHNIQETQLAGPAILDLIVRDLRGILTTNLRPDGVLRIRNRVILGQDADSLDLVTTTDGLIWNYDGERPVRADVNEVGYRIRPNPDSDDFLEIYRREDFGVDDEPFESGSYSFLHDRLKSFDILVYAEDGPDAEPLDEWDPTGGDEEMQGLPARLEIALTLELAPRLVREQLSIAPIDRRTITYRRVIRIPEILRVSQAETPRLAIPGLPSETPEGGGEGGEETPEDENEDGGGGGGGPGGGDVDGLGDGEGPDGD